MGNIPKYLLFFAGRYCRCCLVSLTIAEKYPQIEVSLIRLGSE